MKRLTPQVVMLSLLTTITLFFIGCEKETAIPQLSNLEQSATLAKYFKEYQIITLDPNALYKQAQKVQTQGTGTIELTNLTDAKTICTVHVIPNDLFENNTLLSTEYGAGTENKKVLEGVALSGTVQGNNYHEARFFIAPNFVGGFWTDHNGSELYIEPLQMYDHKALVNQFIIHKASDEIVPAGSQCSSLEKDAKVFSFKRDETKETATCWKVELYCDGDYEYYKNRCGSNYTLAVNSIATAINNTDAKFSSIGLDLVIVGTGIYTDPNAWFYYPTSTIKNTLLDQFVGFHNYFHPSVNRDSWLLFTGKNINGGVAYLSVLCNNKPASYAVMQWYASSSLSVETAHEIGHNLGARHPDNDPNSSGFPAITCYPATAAQSGIMYSVIQPNTYFSSCSKSQMQNHLWYNGNTCLTIGNCQ